MNASQASPAATAASVHAAREGTPGTPADADALQLFVGLLAQAMTPAAPAAVASLASDPPEVEPADETPVDWTLPFLAPPPVTAPPALDLELPDPSLSADVGTVADASADAPLAPLPQLRDRAAAPGKAEVQFELGDVRVGPTGLEVAAQVTTRVEAGSSPGAQSVVRTVHVPVGDQRWPEQVGQEMRLLVDRGVQSATLRVSPEHLGPVEVRIDIVNDKANVVFGASQAETRAALTDAIPKLREMFAGSGLSLGDAGVRQDAPGAQAHADSRDMAGRGFGADEPDLAPGVGPMTVRLGLVDAYA